MPDTDRVRTPSERLFRLAGWCVAVPIVGALLYVTWAVTWAIALVLLEAGHHSPFIYPAAIMLILSPFALAFYIVKRVWKG